MRLLTLLFLTLAGPAQALSCLPPDALRLYTEARDSEDVFSLVIGTIHSDGPINQPHRPAHGDILALTTVTLKGRSLDNEGFQRPFERDITLSLTCLSVWCAAPPPEGQEVFAALRHDGDARLLELSPCPANALPWSGKDEARILNCHLYQRCE